MPSLLQSPFTRVIPVVGRKMTVLITATATATADADAGVRHGHVQGSEVNQLLKPCPKG